MAKKEKASVARSFLGDFAPQYSKYTDEILFDDLWERKELSPRDRSLITVAALVAGENTRQMPFHFNFAKEHGITEEELIEEITHLAFYVGWPKAMTAMMVAKEVFQAGKK
jgi:4-carboxymuconolactone decarboxylase